MEGKEGSRFFARGGVCVMTGVRGNGSSGAIVMVTYLTREGDHGFCLFRMPLDWAAEADSRCWYLRRRASAGFPPWAR